MARNGGRSFAATVVGWILVVLLVYFLFGFLIGTIRWIIRAIAIFVVVGVLGALYFKLRRDE